MHSCFVCERRLPQKYYMYECLNCGIWYSMFPYDPMWYDEGYKRNQEEWLRDNDNARDIRNHRKETITWKLQHHLANKTLSILDVGCGVESALLGIPNTQIRQYDPLFGHKHNDFLPADVTTFFDSFEHFENPHKVVRLTDSYLIYISLPIVPARVVSGEIPLNRWGHYKPREHLILFTKEGLVSYMDKCGYRCDSHDYGEQQLRDEDILSFTFLRRP